MDAVTSHSTLKREQNFSHNRYGRVFALIALPSLVAALAVSVLFFQYNKKSDEQLIQQSAEQLSMLAQGVSENIRGTLHGFQTLIQATALSRADGIASLRKVAGAKLYFEISRSKKQITQVISFSSKQANWGPIQMNLEKALLEHLNEKSFGQIGQGIIFARPDVQQSRQWMGLIYQIQSDQFAGIWVDPNEAFLIAKKKGETNLNDHFIKIALVNEEGRVLSASVPEYSGGDFSGLKGFIDYKNQPKNAQLGVALDDWNVRAFRKIADFPLFIIADQTEERNSGWIRILKDPSLRIQLFGIFALFCGVWGLISFLLVWNWKKAEPVTETAAAIQITPATQEVQNKVPPVPPVPPVRIPMPEIIDQVASEEWKLRKFIDEERLISDFERRSFLAKTPREVSEELVLVASELCHSPVLYFAHYRPTSQMILQSHAGLENLGSLPALAFPAPGVSTVRFTEYEPLQKLILMRFGTAHFEAHTVSAFGSLGRIAQKQQILGVLVILQSNVDSALHQESLNRLIRTTGLIYENAVLAQ